MNTNNQRKFKSSGGSSQPAKQQKTKGPSTDAKFVFNGSGPADFTAVKDKFITVFQGSDCYDYIDILLNPTPAADRVLSDVNLPLIPNLEESYHWDLIIRPGIAGEFPPFANPVNLDNFEMPDAVPAKNPRVLYNPPTEVMVARVLTPIYENIVPDCSVKPIDCDYASYRAKVVVLRRLHDDCVIIANSNSAEAEKRALILDKVQSAEIDSIKEVRYAKLCLDNDAKLYSLNLKYHNF
jgi:hypothetical protein